MRALSGSPGLNRGLVASAPKWMGPCRGHTLLHWLSFNSNKHRLMAICSWFFVGNKACKHEAFTSPPAWRRGARSWAWSLPRGWREARGGGWDRLGGGRWMLGQRDRYFTIRHTTEIDGQRDKNNPNGLYDDIQYPRGVRLRMGVREVRKNLQAKWVLKAHKFDKTFKSLSPLINLDSVHRLLYIGLRPTGAYFVSRVSGLVMFCETHCHSN